MLKLGPQIGSVNVLDDSLTPFANVVNDITPIGIAEEAPRRIIAKLDIAGKGSRCLRADPNP